MKHALPLFLFLLITIGLTAQTSFSQRFALEKERAQVEATTLKIFPNPAADFISVNDNTGIYRIVVYNLVGRKMKTFNAQNGDKHDVSELPKGMYLIQLLGKGDKIITTRRLQKQ